MRRHKLSGLNSREVRIMFRLIECAFRFKVRHLTINAQPETPICFALAVSVSSNIFDTKRVSCKSKTQSVFFERFNCNLMFSVQTSFAITSSPVDRSRITVNEFEETLTEIKIHCIPPRVIAINWLH